MTEQIVKRYKVGINHIGCAVYYENDDGNFVRFYDYTELKSRLAAVEAELDKCYPISEHERLVEIGQRINNAYISRLEQRLAERDALLERCESFIKFVHKCVRKNGEYAPLHLQELDELNRDLSIDRVNGG